MSSDDRSATFALSRVNNFDLIRLVAALQVTLSHAISHLSVREWQPFLTQISHFPGVPIFFVVSGFLVSASYERAPSLRQYLWNRIVRIYPALWVCLLVSTAIIVGSGVEANSALDWVKWMAAQATVLQFYNPDFLRAFGVGVINGSLWTIPVELQFYLVLPLLALAARNRVGVWATFAVIAAVLMLLTRPLIADRSDLVSKLMGVSLLPYLFNFFVGIVGRQLFERWPDLFRGKAVMWAIAYVAWLAIKNIYSIGVGQSELDIVSICLLGLLTLSAAFSLPTLSSLLLKDNDVSYGTYIFHMPIVNLLLAHGIQGVGGLMIVLPATLTCAIASWLLVERPALRLKRYSLLRRSAT